MVKRNILLILLILIVSALTIININADDIEIYNLPYNGEWLENNKEKIIHFEIRNNNDYDVKDLQITIENPDNWNIVLNQDTIKKISKKDSYSLNLKIIPPKTYFYKTTDIKVFLKISDNEIKTHSFYLTVKPPQYFWVLLTLILIGIIVITNVIIFITLNKKTKKGEKYD